MHPQEPSYSAMTSISYIENQGAEKTLPAPSYYNYHLSLNTCCPTSFFALWHARHRSFEMYYRDNPEAHDIGFV